MMMMMVMVVKVSLIWDEEQTLCVWLGNINRNSRVVSISSYFDIEVDSFAFLSTISRHSRSEIGKGRINSRDPPVFRLDLNRTILFFINLRREDIHKDLKMQIFHSPISPKTRMVKS